MVIGKVVVAGLVGLVALACGVAYIPHTDREAYTATVTDKERVMSRSDSKFLVYAELDPTKKVRVFQNTDSLYEWKWNSADVQASLKVGETYRIGTYGWRVPILSWFENIVSVKPVTSKEFPTSSETK